ncbi:hypothetical protein [Shimazuella alba]|uniref:Uncharacterized protein n=1 Tax=Shimazuella alba TaxID=2690964 RepID=A0A6I4W0Z3_9BACL|nr:hypothetical protein [Shimazuella alba]MXQ54364.1 hypothetical protein [Shimazuella alba]
MNPDEKAVNKKKQNETDTEFSAELTGEDHAVKKVQNALFEMYSQAGDSNKEKE